MARGAEVMTHGISGLADTRILQCPNCLATLSRTKMDDNIWECEYCTTTIEIIKRGPTPVFYNSTAKWDYSKGGK